MTGSCDAVNITNNVTLIIAGFNVIDKRGVTPLTCRPLFVTVPSKNSDGTSVGVLQTLVQSHENCIPLVLTIAKESNGVLDEQVAPMLTKFATETKLSKKGETSSILGFDYKAVQMPTDGDMKMHWSGTAGGGAAKVVNHPCHCCAIHSDDIALPGNKIECQVCVGWNESQEINDKDFGEWKCYHKPIITEERKAQLEKEKVGISALVGVVANDLENLRQQSIINHNVDEGDVNSIYYDYYAKANKPQRPAFRKLLFTELQLREMDTSGTVGDMQKRLFKQLDTEEELRKINAELKTTTLTDKTAMYLVLNAVPCVLHLENRVGIKIITRLLRIGLANYLEKDASKTMWNTSCPWLLSVWRQ